LAILLDMPQTHVPVLAGELIEALDPQPGQIAVDCTLGGAGHARLVAERLGAAGTLIAIDRDPTAEHAFNELAAEVACQTRFIRADFASGLEQIETRVDLVYMDLGMSSMQVDTRERGFSYAYDAPLDMRMDPGQALDARALVAEWDERRLARLFRNYGEERFAGPIARAIVRARGRQPIATTHELVEALARGRVAVDGDQRARGAEALGDQPGVPAGAERAVHGDLARLWVEQLDQLAGEHRDVGLGHLQEPHDEVWPKGAVSSPMSSSSS
jgi:16S rRNA (cytosine1402-N4)-methyltransferase